MHSGWPIMVAPREAVARRQRPMSSIGQKYPDARPPTGECGCSPRNIHVHDSPTSRVPVTCLTCNSTWWADEVFDRQEGRPVFVAVPDDTPFVPYGDYLKWAAANGLGEPAAAARSSVSSSVACPNPAIHACEAFPLA